MREHEHAPPRIPREGVLFREPPDVAGARVSTHVALPIGSHALDGSISKLLGTRCPAGTEREADFEKP